MTDTLGTEDRAYLGFRIANRLLHLLVKRNVITAAEGVALLEEIADDLSQDRRAVAQRSVGYLRDTLIPEHQRLK